VLLIESGSVKQQQLAIQQRLLEEKQRQIEAQQKQIEELTDSGQAKIVTQKTVLHKLFSTGAALKVLFTIVNSAVFDNLLRAATGQMIVSPDIR